MSSLTQLLFLSGYLREGVNEKERKHTVVVNNNKYNRDFVFISSRLTGYRTFTF